MADQIYTTQADSGVDQGFDAEWHTVGPRFRLSETGKLKGGRAYYPSVEPTTSFFWAVYRVSDHAIVAQVDLLATFPSPALSAWNNFTSADFDTPGDVDLAKFPSDEYIVVVATDRDIPFKNTDVTYPVSSGGIVTGVEGRSVDGGTGIQFPSNPTSTIYFFADVDIEISGIDYTVTTADSAGLADMHSMARAAVHTDNTGLTDTVALMRSTAAVDTAGLTDPYAAARSAAHGDSVGLTDAATVDPSTLHTATDDAGLTDALTLAWSAALTDYAGLTDALAIAREAARTDDTGLTDSATVVAALAAGAADDTGLSDSFDHQLGAGVDSVDSAGLTDAFAMARAIAFSDSAGLTDTTMLTRLLERTDSAGLTDSAATTRAIQAADDTGLTDTSEAVNVITADAEDLVGLTDGVAISSGRETVLLPPGLLPVRVLSPQEILTGNRVTRIRYDLFSRTEAALGVLDGVTKGKLDFTASATVHSGGLMEIKDNGQSVDWLNDRVRPVIMVEGLPDEPLGMYVFPESPEDWSGTGRSWSVKLMDKTSILNQDKVEGTYSLDVGTVITTAVTSLILSTGETNLAVTPSAATLSAPLSWEPQTPKLRIVNDLLAVAGYFSLWCDGNGQYRAEPYVRPAARPIVYEFVDGGKSIYSPDFVRDVDFYGVPNKFVAVGKGSGDTPALISVATNEDPESPYSFPSRGRWIVDGATGVEAANQDVLDSYARRRLIELTSPTSAITVAHAFVPGLTFNHAVRLRRVPAGIDARHTVSKTVVELSATSLVKTTLTEVVDL